MKIIFEDKYIVVLEKPAGILSVPYPGFKGKTIFDKLYENRRKRGLIRGTFRPYTVHRLDKDTSGIMMFALTQEAQRIIMNTWQTMVKNRTYRALCEAPKRDGNRIELAEKGIINKPLSLNTSHHSYVTKKVPPQKKHGAPKEAITHYKILSKTKRYTMFELELETGRTNQIRAHLSFVGYPIAGDTLYRSKTDPFKRLCLHARTLVFTHPFTKQVHSFEVTEPASWHTV